MTQIVYLNGSYCKASEAKISIFDRGLTFADSIYEIIPVYKGHLFYAEKHLKRVEYSLSNAKIPSPDLDWYSIFNHLIEQNGKGDMQIYLQITRGNQGNRQYDIPSAIEPTVIAYTIHTPYPTIEEKMRGLQAQLIEDIRWLRCDIKATTLLANVLLHEEARSQGNKIALLSRNGCLTEGSASNVFLVDAKGTLLTPPLNNLCLSGITRQITIELINALSWPLREAPIPTEAIFSAKEVWITSTTKEIYPVTHVNDSVIANGQVGDYWKEINEKYQQLIEHL
ncbi:D-alanine aminotransferase [Legionella massiliensis]|uniref:Aminodeoxychorismate lyase n=1 Tax=Legionella massiliensis TaxID=1034943 RepID=A0A078KZJ3_9GAMM|nr:aminotransferase class IV [Legionella massiliensis]CDZ78346.1 D-alanine aminotransferase [Legionella massiliensis]CEE14084.1 D-alanine aminotransferase [Legionella massiliensis]